MQLYILRLLRVFCRIVMWQCVCGRPRPGVSVSQVCCVHWHQLLSACAPPGGVWLVPRLLHHRGLHTGRDSARHRVSHDIGIRFSEVGFFGLAEDFVPAVQIRPATMHIKACGAVKARHLVCQPGANCTSSMHWTKCGQREAGVFHYLPADCPLNGCTCAGRRVWSSRLRASR